MPQYADEIRRKRLIAEAHAKLTACQLKMTELTRQIKDVKVEIDELEAQMEKLAMMEPMTKEKTEAAAMLVSATKALRQHVGLEDLQRSGVI